MNNKTIFFQSSLPRSGSTLLQNLIGQNPNFHVSPTSGLGRLLNSCFTDFTENTNFLNLDLKVYTPAFTQFCKGGINSYYDSLTDKPFILDKSRSWLRNINKMKVLYPDLKIICLVRDLRGVFSSFEKWYRNNPLKIFPFQEEGKNIKLEDRMRVYKDNEPLEPFLSALRDTIHIKDNLNNIHFIKYEDLCSNPGIICKEIYDFLEIKYFNHDFNNIKQITFENDNHIVFGEHSIKSKIIPSKNNWEHILGKGFCDLIYNEYNWYFNYFDYKK